MKILSDCNLEQLLAFLTTREQFVFLDTARPDPENDKSLLFLNPISRLQCRPHDDGSLFLAQIESALRAGYYVAGWFGYEFGYLLEENLRPLLRRPDDESLLLADLGVFSAPYSFDHRTGMTDFPGLSSASEAATLPASSVCQVSHIRPSQNRDAYLQALQAIQDYILAGDTYQVNYTLKLLFDFCGSPEALYATLRRNQSVAYGAYLRFGDQGCERLLSFSPELFFKKDAQSITVRPMKGTLRRGRFPQEDQERVSFLRHDAKNRSENVMIVDLLRNDLGRLLHGLGDEPLVRAASLFDVERYETLLQMTSTIVAAGTRDCLASLTLSQLFQSLFPCGSVTGAPKIRTMEIINELESTRRGPYTGAIGYLAPTGAAFFNVPIRTVALHGITGTMRGEMGIGSGVIACSNPEQEWQECLLKGSFLASPPPAFELIETLLWEPDGGYWLLRDHLERLRASADYFLFCCDLPLIKQRLVDESRGFAAVPMRVRLTLAKDGGLVFTSQPCALPRIRHLPSTPDLRSCDLPRIGLSPTPIDSSVPWFFHKTTRRELYDRELQQARAKGLLDCCFVNECGELTEGCIANIILYGQGVYSTPPLQCGLLAGIMRKCLLADPRTPLREMVLTKEDLRRAEAVFLCNSVRGVVQVVVE